MKTLELLKTYSDTGWRFELVFPYSLAALEYSEHYGNKCWFFALLGLTLFISREDYNMQYDRDVAWGFTFSSAVQALYLYWGSKCKILYYPWADYICVRDQLMDEYGNLWNRPKWITFRDGTRDKEDEPPNLYERLVPYKYKLKNGQVQNVMAKVKVEEREWRLRLLQWTQLFNKVNRCIWVEFDHEVGERTGSFKGGVMGCGYTMLPGEDPIDCLNRMEFERQFN